MMRGQASTAAGFPIRIYRGGDDADLPPAVFVNGCALTSELWEPVIERLAGRQWLAFDRPGLTTPLGSNANVRGLRALNTHVKILEELAASFDRPVVLVVHSMGAIHAEALARTRPEVVAGIVLVDPSVEPNVRRALPAGLAAWVGQLKHRAKLSALGGRIIRGGSTLATRLSREQLPQNAHPVSVRGSALEWLHFRPHANAAVELRARHGLPKIPVRALLAPPRLDGLTEIWVGAASYDAQLYDDARHLLMLDYPDAVARAIATL
ncbi:alpha/beta fold hydrolase [Trueperella bialowiezensis]|uniref:Haloalkane dehalogenase n=1 Tax=Trueperella bialowiezensis TaxID=312285 RepID=A0A3S4VUH4_9ACTO|nr:alpha/beta hydrolase [Trueperella bialowiezensis]VEI13977.1 haloalkane dehalogenase [Trueperella bialowiezensis]